MLKVEDIPMLKIKHLPTAILKFDHSQFGFGDRWSVCNYILRTSEDLGRTTLVASHCWHDDIPLIMRNLASTGTFEFVNLPATHNVEYCATFGVSFCPTRNYAWSPNKSKLICYQLDGRWKAEDKNLTREETKALFTFLRNSGYTLVDVGNMRPLEESIRLLSNAEAFIGVPSGMSHVNNSVGAPAYIICKPAIGRSFHTGCIYHNKPNVRLFDDTQALIDFLFRLSQNAPGLDYIPML